MGKKGKDGKVYVLGSGNAKPLAEYIKDIRDVVEPEAAVELGALPYSDKQVMHLEADIEEVTKDIGWEPQISFRKGIKNIIEKLSVYQPIPIWTPVVSKSTDTHSLST